MKYEANWESIDSRPIPKWFDEAKFGIMIHWGVYSVPAWAPKGTYAEWYWASMGNKDGDTWKYHAKNYGENFKYQDFANLFKAELYDPDEWAEIFKQSGARYVVPTSKHHDGFCLWQSPHSWNWNSVDIGPHRDLLGDMAKAVRNKGMMMGFYYSLYEWYRPLFLLNPERYALEHMIPQMKDVITRYEPSILFTDGEWDHPSDVWHSCEFLAWLLNESSCKDEIVINDRWGKETRSQHGGYFTTEYGQVGWGKDIGMARKWEECRGIGGSFGYNRNESIAEYAKASDIIHLLIGIVSKGGNLELNVGPTADGRIPVIMQQRLLEIGEWLKVNGDAIYGTHPWREVTDGDFVCYTAKDEAVYAICKKFPERELVLNAPKPCKDVSVTMLGKENQLEWRHENGKFIISVPFMTIDEVPSRHAYVFKLNGVE
ncbi:MAG: alpha-L-fucosidase [Candidatus Poribacteria bacterium]